MAGAADGDPEPVVDRSHESRPVRTKKRKIRYTAEEYDLSEVVVADNKGENVLMMEQKDLRMEEQLSENHGDTINEVIAVESAVDVGASKAGLVYMDERTVTMKEKFIEAVGETLSQ